MQGSIMLKFQYSVRRKSTLSKYHTHVILNIKCWTINLGVTRMIPYLSGLLDETLNQGPDSI